MAECDWAILCDYAFLDVQRKMCIIGVFDQVFAPAVPSSLHQSSLAVKLLGQPDESVAFKVAIIRPSGGQLAAFEGTVQMGDRGAAEIQVNIAGLPLPDYGLYSFNIYVGDELLRTAGFLVTSPPQAQQQSSEAGR